MNRSMCLAATLLACAALAPAARAGDGDYRALLRKLPDTTTALVLIDVDALRQALGVTKGTALAEARVTAIPVKATKFVLGAHVDLSERRHLWSVALAQLDGTSIQDIAKAENSVLQTVGGLQAVVSPRNAYFLELGPNLLAAATPANRKMLSRWLAFEKANQIDSLAPYLLRAAADAAGAVMVLAVDLEDSVDAPAIRRGLTRSQVLSALENVDYDAVARVIAAAKGMRLIVRPGAPLAAELSVDFDADTGPVQPFAKALLIETLQNTGLYAQDFDDWQAKVTDRSITLRGPLSVNGLRKFGSLIPTPAPPPAAGDMAAYQAASTPSRNLAASQRYFQSVTQILEDLKFDKANTAESRSGWFEHAATQINNLPTLDVAPELVQYGATTADMLQSMSTVLKNVSTRVQYVRQNAFYSYYGPGLIIGNPTTGYVSAKKVVDELTGLAAQSRRQLWDKIDDVTAKVRNQLTQRFNTQF